MKENTNVYVPVKTPDHKKWALLLALLIHSGVLGFIIYTNHPKNLDEPVMETTLVTPEQLSAIQGQIAANQNNQANNTGDSLNADGKNLQAPSMSEFLAGGSHSNMPVPQPMPSPEAQAIADELAQRQAEFERQRDAIAEKLDREAEAELKGVAETIDQQQIQNNQLVREYKLTESNADNETEALRQAAEKATKALQAQREMANAQKNANNKNFGIQADPNAGAGTGQTQGGNDTPRGGNRNGSSSAGYLNRIIGIIYAHWNPPINSKGKDLTAQFNISPSGNINGVKIISGSNDEAFKNSLIQAINSSSPLPPPPTDSYSDFQHNEFKFRAK